MDVFSASDLAGCTKTRRSTSSSYMMLDGHLIASSATTQNVADMAKVVKPRVRVDATASKAIASRRGVRRVRHLHTHLLWVQEAVARREVTIAKVPGCEKPADLGTKHLAQREMHECMRGTFKVGVDGRNGVRLEPASLWGCGNDKSRTSIEIDKGSRMLRDVETHAQHRLSSDA